MGTLHEALSTDCVHRLRERAVAERRSRQLAALRRSERRATTANRRAGRAARRAELRAQRAATATTRVARAWDALAG